MSATITNLKTRKPINEADFQPGNFLWWGQNPTPETASGYPILVVEADFPNGKLTFINLNAIDDTPRTCPITDPYLHPISKERAADYVRHAAENDYPSKSLRQTLTKACKRFWQDWQEQRDIKLTGRNFKAISKRRGLL